MTAVVIDGRLHANNVLQELKRKIDILSTKHRMIPGLGIVLVGEDPASAIYVKNKLRTGREVGIHTFEYRFNENASQKILISKIEHLNNDLKIHGIVVQLPLPKSIDTHKITSEIDPDKDVDGFNITNIGKLNAWQDSLEPCTPRGVIILLKKVLGNDLSGKKVAVIGRSGIVGRPLASLLLRENCTVTIMHSKSIDIGEECSKADVLISAVGIPNFVQPHWIKKGACVIDVGITRIDDSIHGDVDFAEASKIAEYITPVPGGVGPMTVACMLENTVKALCNQKRINFDAL